MHNVVHLYSLNYMYKYNIFIIVYAWLYFLQIYNIIQNNAHNISSMTTLYKIIARVESKSIRNKQQVKSSPEYIYIYRVLLVFPLFQTESNS